MSHPPSASSQQRSASAGHQPSASSSTLPLASASASTTPLLQQTSFGAGSPNLGLPPTSPYAASGFSSTVTSPAFSSFQQGSNPYSASATPAVSTFRKLIWEGTIPICVSIDPAELPAGSDSSIDSTYLVVPRISYLPLIIADVKKNLLELVLEQPALNTLNEKELWFEYEGQPLRWHWQIGLLYDYHTSNAARTAIAYQSASAATTSGLGSLRPETPQPTQSSADSGALLAAQPSRLPWNIRLRLSKPPVDRLHSNSGLESCKASFMSMIKEADFVRYGSTKKVVNLRKQEQDTLWDGVTSHDYDLFWSIANKLVPSSKASPFEAGSGGPSTGRSPNAARTSSLNLGSAHEDRTAPMVQRSLTNQPNESQASLAPSTVSTITSTTSSDVPSATSGTATSSAGNSVRSIPIRIFLPDNAPIVQEPAPPMLDDGRPNTLGAVLSGLFPLLFPPPPSFSSFQPQAPPLAFALVQGVRMPLDTEIAWLGSALVGPDGWVAVVIGLAS